MSVIEDHNEPTWKNQLWHARKLLAEKGREALDNPHGMIGRKCGCNTCFTCAAAFVVAEYDRSTDIYTELKDTGIPLFNHESDLYVPVTDVTRAIVDRYEFKANVKTFRDQVSGGLMFDIPFAYMPFWADKAKGGTLKK